MTKLATILTSTITLMCYHTSIETALAGKYTGTEVDYSPTNCWCGSMTLFSADCAVTTRQTTDRSATIKKQTFTNIGKQFFELDTWYCGRVSDGGFSLSVVSTELSSGSSLSFNTILVCSAAATTHSLTDSTRLSTGLINYQKLRVNSWQHGNENSIGTALTKRALSLT